VGEEPPEPGEAIAEVALTAPAANVVVLGNDSESRLVGLNGLTWPIVGPAGRLCGLGSAGFCGRFEV
jgi:hypothetical protein